MLLFISGSYPNNQEGIAAGAKVLLDSMTGIIDKKNIMLLTTDVPIITENIKNNVSVEYETLKNWKLNFSNIKKFISILNKKNFTAIHIEYPGDLYGKTILASFIPLLVKIYNTIKSKNISVNVRLHEFYNSRFLRKIAILPIIWFSNRIYIPSEKDRKIISRLTLKPVFQTIIGSNINVVSNKLINNNKIIVSYFGSVYPGKGIERMLSIWNKVKEYDSKNIISFKIIGDIGTEKENHFRDYHKKIWKLIESYNLGDFITVTGYVSDEIVSKEIQHSQVATLLYEDGLTLRRGSFLAYLSHGIPIVTTSADSESFELFNGHNGVSMNSNDNEIFNSIINFCKLNNEIREQIRLDNISLFRFFDWHNIANKFLDDYKVK